MKKVIFVLIIAVLLLCSCNSKENSENLEFLNTKWGMSMVETLDAYGVTEKDTSYYKEGSAFIIKDKDLYGEKTSEIIFNFVNFDAESSKLCAVSVIYPDNADMDKIYKEMKKEYGKTVSNISIYNLFTPFEDTLSEKKYSESAHLKLWASNKSIFQSISEQERESYCDLWKNYQTALNDENWNTFSQTAKMATVIWTDNAEINSIDKNSLEFNGYNLLVYDEIKNQLSNQK